VLRLSFRRAFPRNVTVSAARFGIFPSVLPRAFPRVPGARACRRLLVVRVAAAVAVGIAVAIGIGIGIGERAAIRVRVFGAPGTFGGLGSLGSLGTLGTLIAAAIAGRHVPFRHLAILLRCHLCGIDLVQESRARLSSERRADRRRAARSARSLVLKQRFQNRHGGFNSEILIRATSREGNVDKDRLCENH